MHIFFVKHMLTFFATEKHGFILRCTISKNIQIDEQDWQLVKLLLHLQTRARAHTHLDVKTKFSRKKMYRLTIYKRN